MPQMLEYCMTYGHEYHPGETECRACGNHKPLVVSAPICNMCNRPIADHKALYFCPAIELQAGHLV